jgi:hypothetical protein
MPMIGLGVATVDHLSAAELSINYACNRGERL